MQRAVILLALLACSALADNEWDHWNPSPPLGPRPSPIDNTPENLNDMMNMTRQTAQWCEGCILRCILWRNKDMKDCSIDCLCPVPPNIVVRQTPFLPSNDTAEICPHGYAPTPVVHPATNNMTQRHIKRNIVIFLLDDLDELVTPYWQAMPFAKSLFLDHGVKFSNAFSSTSICCAARCQLLTGLYGHNVGVLTNNGKYGGHRAFLYPSAQDGSRLKDSQGRCINNEDRTLPLFLQQAGYKTAIWGKYMNGIEDDDTGSINSPVPPGWDEFGIGASRGLYTGYSYTLTKWDSSRDRDDIDYEAHGTKEEDYSTDVLRKKAVSWIHRIREDHEDAPLFMHINPTAPHFPIAAAPRHKSYSNRWNDMYNATIPNRPNWKEDLSDKPAYLRDTIPLRKTLADSPWFKLEFVKRMGSLMAVDDLIREVHDKFDEIGELDKTVFIMTADNGYNNGAHMLTHKMAPYEESIRIPMYFSGGGIFQGKVIHEPALLIDLAPTILDFANMQPPEHMDGKSWWYNLLFDMEAGPHRSDVYLQYRRYVEGEQDSAFSEISPTILAIVPHYLAIDVAPYRGIRNSEVLFVENVEIYDNGTVALDYEAYNLATDPYQLNNIAKEMPADKFEKLKSDLNRYGKCSGKNCWQV